MKRNFTNENFEQFLQQNADGLRMRPSDKVWKGISRKLNEDRRRWYYIFGFSLLLFTGLGYYLTQNSEKSTASRSTVQPGASIHRFNPSSDIAKQIGSETIPQHNLSKSRPSSGVSAAITRGNAKLASAPQTESASLPKEQEFIPETVDSYTGENMERNKQEGGTELNAATDPQTIESIINTYQARNRKLGLQLYFTPTVSYRKLSDNNIDNMVTHRPDFGFELGMAAKYPVSRNVKLRGGLQLNVSRYAIRTYESRTEVATIRLNSRRGVNYVNTITNYNNFSGYQSNWLENFYFQVSAPVGVEVKLRGDDHVQFGIASTLQPTYLLGDRAYLISSDYKNYAQVPNLIRHWNLNTSIETFVSYSTGQLKWQVGPQARYQIFSSYVNKYPVKENLFDFGLKIGVSLNNQ
ncbi:MAG: hypothetical protein ACJ75B_15900 [Flavisolibacter sp.]